jgi:ABC-type lipoprotein release transport system permease subunit
VVNEVHNADPRPKSAPIGTFYLPYEQVTARSLTFVVRTRASSGAVLGIIRKEIAAIDPELPVFRVRPMQEWIDRALIARRLSMIVASAFGLLALFLAAVGVYGVLASGVSHRRREFGVRMALGSTAGGIFRLVLREGVLIVGGGLAVGVSGSMFVGRLMKAQLFGVGSADPRIIAGVAAILAAIAFVAVAVPSWRASSVDPVTALNA